MRKKLLIILSVIVLLAGALAAVWFCLLNPYRGTEKGYVTSLPLQEKLTKDQAAEDLAFLMKMVRSRHPAWLEKENAGVQAVEAQYAKEISALPESPDTLELWQIAGRILSPLHDGHTSVFCKYDEYRYIDSFLPLQEYGEPAAINGEPVDEVFARFCEVYSYEREVYARTRFVNNILVNESYLAYAGVDTSDGVRYTYETEDGPLEVSHRFVPIGEVTRKADEEDGKWVYWEIDEENDAGIFTLTTCDYNAEYKAAVKAFFEEVSAKGIGNVIVDLRWNGGGSSLVADEFLHYLDVDGYYTWPNKIRFGNFLYGNKKEWNKNRRLSPAFSGGLYVLTNTATFSAAMDFAMLVSDNGLGLVVGEASGNLPDSYGDVLYFTLPNSRLALGVSFKRWYRIDETKAGLPIEPDIPCGSDEALDKALEDIRTKLME